MKSLLHRVALVHFHCWLWQEIMWFPAKTSKPTLTPRVKICSDNTLLHKRRSKQNTANTHVVKSHFTWGSFKSQRKKLLCRIWMKEIRVYLHCQLNGCNLCIYHLSTTHSALTCEGPWIAWISYADKLSASCSSHTHPLTSACHVLEPKTESDRGSCLSEMPRACVMDIFSASLIIRLVPFCLFACVCNPHTPKLPPLIIIIISLPSLYFFIGTRASRQKRLWHWANWQKREWQKDERKEKKRVAFFPVV